MRRCLLLLSILACYAPLMSAQTTALALVHVTVINPSRGKPQPDRVVIIKGSTITAVLAAKDFRPSPSLRVIDGSKKFVIPGLWDMHVHFRDAARDLKMDLANGVLGIRNMGGAPKDVFPIRDAIASGQRLGPKIVASGPIMDGPDSWSNPDFTVSVRNPEEARAQVRSLKQQGSDFIKVYDGLPRDAYFAIAGECRQLGLPFAGHLPSAVTVREASLAGQRTIEHSLVLSGGSSTEDQYIRMRLDTSIYKKARETKDFALIPAKIARDENFMLDHFSQSRAEQTYQFLARHHTFLTPTLVTERALTYVDDLVKQSDPRMAYVSADELKWWRPENGMLTRYRTPEYVAMRKREYELTKQEIPRAERLGVRFLAGTDITVPYTYPGYSLHDELKLFVDAGLTPTQALETATTNPALLLGLSRTWGRIAPGYSANLVLLNANPLEDISNTRNINAVVVNGKLLDRNDLNRLLDEAKAPVTSEK